MSCHNVSIRIFYNVNKLCQVIVGNPPIYQGLKSPQLQGPRVIRLTSEVGPSELLLGLELV